MTTRMLHDLETPLADPQELKLMYEDVLELCFRVNGELRACHVGELLAVPGSTGNAWFGRDEQGRMVELVYRDYRWCIACSDPVIATRRWTVSRRLWLAAALVLVVVDVVVGKLYDAPLLVVFHVGLLLILWGLYLGWKAATAPFRWQVVLIVGLVLVIGSFLWA